ncbi:MAG: hypothetical protein SGARI_001124 [Bacillariaceae sp.]
MGLAGRVVMGASRVNLPDKPSDAHVIRLAGVTNEDLYRVFHECLLPVSDKFGLQFYKDRIRAHQSEIASDRPVNGVDKKQNSMNAVDEGPVKGFSHPFQSTSNDSAFWSIVMLADSGLPTGSFAHSAGLETAAQLGMIQSEQDVENFVNAATRSAMQVSAPFLIAGHGLAAADDSNFDVSHQWQRLHEQCQAILATNEPACSASIDQGKSLARIAAQWLKDSSSPSTPIGVIDKVKTAAILECLNHTSPHVAPTLGAICGLLGLDESQVCRLFAYCVARDLVSAAVRLSLVGPLASVSLLHRVQQSAEDGLEAIASKMKEKPYDPLMAAAASAPVRLFRS